METFITKVGLVYHLLEVLDEVQNEAAQSITSFADIVEQFTAAIEEILASGEEQLASTDQLVTMSQELENLITMMKEHVSCFITKA